MFEVIKQWFIKHMPVQEDIGLHENKAFLRWITYPLLVILAIAFAITWNLFETGIYSFDKEFELSFITLNDFAKYYAFPIASLTVPLTFGVMFNRFHSSKQKAKSNRLVEQNNSANNYFNHYKYFSEFCESLSNNFFKKTENISPAILYKRLFPDASVVHFTTEVSEKFLNDIFLDLHTIIDDYEHHLLNTEKTVISSPHETGNYNKVEIIDVVLFKEPFKFRLACSGIYYEEVLSSPKNMMNSLKKIESLIFMLFQFSGISNHKQLTNNFNIKINTLGGRLNSEVNAFQK
ncbi:hypothetical protein MKZ42_05375 [Pseudoalteromonas shioyasakiensis]|uniref:Uncharacterized protein n=1 Tax=Pseudoalteromonas shioyasakiensis TaxID=1190813 RepID=A0ABT6TW03_9GAMM|nr:MULTISPECIES: hypothetical protein [Pseudoalteromonas]MDI4668079.1 hypothetical protein [Pseudoalteromonas shioyasakiensis]MDI4672691.1 hypothetical protein [Pseudoalteromonas shioyasakiensis]MDI4684755.1 hypothetical protein [Pseudoalteromonas shioyasakiensis]MDI4703281.1 hypothetical protein [Pseudoalteromonas shioyasakiensis]NUJ20092.1 hypothetical protein [Pseudoalteromonas sp. 0802]